MYKTILLGFLLIIFSCKTRSNNPNIPEISVKEKDAEYNLSFTSIGYIDSFPVFANYLNSELLVSREVGKLDLYMKYTPEHYIPQFICKSGIIFRYKDTVIVQNNSGNFKKYYIKEGLYLTTGNTDMSKVIVVNKKFDILLINLKDDSTINLNTKANDLIYIRDNNLYFGRFREDNDLVNIYKINLNEILVKDISLIAENISGDPWIIMPDTKYIVCEGPYTGKVPCCLAILNNINKTFHYVDLEISNESVNYSTTCSYYTYQERAIVFYDPRTFKGKVVKLE